MAELAGIGSVCSGYGGLDLRTQIALLGTPTTRDWKDGGYQANVPVNGLLGRMVWELTPGDDSDQLFTGGNQSSVA